MSSNEDVQQEVQQLADGTQQPAEGEGYARDFYWGPRGYHYGPRVAYGPGYAPGYAPAYGPRWVPGAWGGWGSPPRLLGALTGAPPCSAMAMPASMAPRRRSRERFARFT